MKLASDVKAGLLLSWNEEGLLCVAELPNTKAVGMAARDLAAGDEVDYNPIGNTKDILTSGHAIGSTGTEWYFPINDREEKRSWAIAALLKFLKIWRSE